MASNVNVNFTNPRNGSVVSVTRRLIDYSVSWDDDANVHHTASGTLTWPDILTNAALPAGWTADQQQAVVYAAGRIILGIDTGL